MCGIFAYSGPGDVTQTLMDGLRKLEYRGYDSSGIAFFSTDDRIQCVRACGDISELEKLLSDEVRESSGKTGVHSGMTSSMNGSGIGHTRWATHGAPTKDNAHPHRAGPFYVIHNGVIENEGELKNLIDPQSLASETDTEVIAHLLLRFYKEEKGDLVKSVFKTMNCLKGSYAVTVLCEERPGEMIAFKQGPPLALCKGEGWIISSDIYSVGEDVQEVIFLEDGEALFLKDQEFQIYDRQGRKIQKEFKIIPREQSLLDKKGFPHFMLKEIFEQPDVTRKILENSIHRHEGQLNVKPAGGDHESFNRLIKKVSSVRIVACGSSYFAGLFGKYLIEEFADVMVEVEPASEFIYRKAVFDTNTLILFISQSGETADTLTALNRVKEKGLKTISLCNVPNSSLDRQVDYGFYMQAGQEVGVASTKAFTSSLIWLILLAFHFSKERKTLSSEREKSLVKSLLQLPPYMEQVLGYEDFFLETAEALKTFSGFLYLGRGVFYPIALEGALKLKEIAYIHAEGYPAGEMKHGPLALIDKNKAVVALLPSEGILYDKTLTNLKEARTRGAEIIGLGGKDTSELKKLCNHYLPLPKLPEFLLPVLAVIPLQMMAYYISRSFGYNADRPRNLAKSVTVE
ncbi:MAG: glutamine--fructose-6-phosphate transaminase (isomerizing) [Bdellovibrionales bacterium]|nr:glutamine--fructose-6-phosphate transaminase (isomerizing) [Bdellovibrionales bacterium]